jgi:hypothetical protein
MVDGALAVGINVAGTVLGEVLGFRGSDFEGGSLRAQLDIGTVGAGGRVTAVKIDTFGGGDSSRPLRPTKTKSREAAKAKSPTKVLEEGEKQNAAPATRTNVDVGNVSGGQVIGTQINQRGGDTVHGNQVPVGAGGQATLRTGIRGENLQIGSVTIYEGWQPGVSKAYGHAIEEKVRLDVALPKTAVVDEAFDLVIAIKQPSAPVLSLTDLDQVISAEGSIFRSDERDVVKYRIEVTGAGFQITPPSYLLALRVGEDSRPIAFQIVSSRAGRRSLLVNAYQEDGVLAAQTRLTIDITVSVSGPRG